MWYTLLVISSKTPIIWTFSFHIQEVTKFIVILIIHNASILLSTEEEHREKKKIEHNQQSYWQCRHLYISKLNPGMLLKLRQGRSFLWVKRPHILGLVSTQHILRLGFSCKLFLKGVLSGETSSNEGSKMKKQRAKQGLEFWCSEHQSGSAGLNQAAFPFWSQDSSDSGTRRPLWMRWFHLPKGFQVWIIIIISSNYSSLQRAPPGTERDTRAFYTMWCS